MAEKKEKVRIPVYRMGLRELYLLLRIRMEQQVKTIREAQKQILILLKDKRKCQRGKEVLPGAGDL